MSEYKALVLVGYPGSGKGTIARMLTKYGGFYHLSTGELFDALKVKEDKSEQEVMAWKHMSESKYVPDDITLELFKLEVIRRVGVGEYNPESQFLVLDGIPRTPSQIEPVEKFVDVTQVLYLNIGSKFREVRNIVVPRILNRRRNARDADPKKIISRLYEYKNENTFEIVDYYRSLDKLQEVQNTGSVEALQMFTDRYVPFMLSKKVLK